VESHWPGASATPPGPVEHLDRATRHGSTDRPGRQPAPERGGPDPGPPGGVFEGLAPADAPHQVEGDGDGQPALATAVSARLAAWHRQFLAGASHPRVGPPGGEPIAAAETEVFWSGSMTPGFGSRPRRLPNPALRGWGPDIGVSSGYRTKRASTHYEYLNDWRSKPVKSVGIRGIPRIHGSRSVR
jgi:hypothetical protein